MHLKNTDFKEVGRLLAEKRHILLTTHTNPDGDAIGSILAFYRYLIRKGHHVSMMVPDPYPSFLSWLHASEKILVYSEKRDDCLRAIDRANLIFALDYNDLDRIKEAGDRVRRSDAIKIVLDHHLYPADHFNLVISVADTSSTSELVFDFISAAGDEHLIDKPIAEALYTGIVTDTGSFSYSCNRVGTYKTIAELFRHGIDGEHIHRLVYDTFSEHRLRLLGHSLSERLIVLPEYHSAFIYLSAEDLDHYKYRTGDTEGVVDFALSISGINLAALFTERDNSIRISFRSKGNFSVERLARDHFQGGGHTNASGATSYMTLQETVKKFRDLLPEYRQALSEVYP